MNQNIVELGYHWLRPGGPKWIQVLQLRLHGHLHLTHKRHVGDVKIFVLI